MRHLAGRRCELSQKPGAASFLHFLGKLVHGLLRNNAAFATRKRSLGVIERKKKFRPLALAFFPQGKSFPHGILFRVQSSALNRAAGESLLVRRKVYVHCLRVRKPPASGKLQIGGNPELSLRHQRNSATRNPATRTYSSARIATIRPQDTDSPRQTWTAFGLSLG
jgi:hypothetical protein